MENLEALYKKFLEVPDHASEKVAILDHNINHTNLNGNGEIQSLKFFHQYYFWVEKTDKWKCNYTILEMGLDNGKTTVTLRNSINLEYTTVIDHPLHEDDKEFLHLVDLFVAMAYYHHPKRQQPLYELFLDKCIKEAFGEL